MIFWNPKCYQIILQELEKQKQKAEEEQQRKIAAEKLLAEEKQKKEAENNVPKSENTLLGIDPSQKTRRASRFEVKTIVTPPEDENKDESSNPSTSNVPLATKEDTALSPDSKEG